MDFGAVVDFYHSDMTRTVAVGEISSKQAEVYETVLEAQIKAIEAVKAGEICNEVDKVARDIIRNKGYGEYFGHGYGHSLGLEIHESPSPNARNEAAMPAYSVASAEPGIYLPGKFGVRIEDTCVFLEDGIEILTASPKNLIII